MKVQDMKNRIENISTELNGLKAKAEEGTATAEDLASVKALIEERNQLKAQLEAAQTLASLEPDSIEASAVHVVGPAAEQEKYSLGQYLQDIAKSAQQIQGGGNAIPRVANYQKKVLAAATGNNETVGSEGGFLVGEELSDEIIKRVYENNAVISRCRKRTLTGNANKISLNGIDETSRATGSRHGGVRSYWLAEADSMTASRPKWRKMNFELKKHGVLYYATDEVLQDASMLEQEVEDAVADEIAFAIQDSIINGDGAGKPLGILNSPALVSQAKETGQPAATIQYENILKMLTRKWGPLTNYVWLINQEIFPQLGIMNVAVGTGGAPVYLPGGGAADAPFQRLSSLPIIEIEQAAALGTAGDIILADLSQYMVIDKGGLQSAMSIHVSFTTDETVYRWIYRIDGMPTWNAPLTPYKGTATRSPFVALATRS